MSSSGCVKGLAVGCLVLVLALAGAAWYAWTKMPSLAAAGLEAATGKAFDELQMPPEERAATEKPVRELAERIRRGELSWAQFGAVTKELLEGSVLKAGAVRMLETRYLASAGLTAEELAAARTAGNRFAAGVVAGKIPRAKMDEILDLVSTQTTDGNGGTQRTFKPAISPEDARKIVGLLTDAADAAGIPADAPPIDLGDEIRQAIDRGLAPAKP